MNIGKQQVEFSPLVDRNGKVYKERWPYLNGVKAVSPSTFSAPLFALVYGITPFGITHSGMTDGIDFENALAHFMGSKNLEIATEMVKNDKLKPRFKRLANILKNQKDVINIEIPFARNTIGYCEFEGMFVACESDMEFPNYILELKKTNLKGKSKLKLNALKLAYDIQATIQWLCFKKPIHLVWASDTGIRLKTIKEMTPLVEKYAKMIVDFKKRNFTLEIQMEMLQHELELDFNETNDRPQ